PTATAALGFRAGLVATSYISRELGLYRERSLDSVRTVQSADRALSRDLCYRRHCTWPRRAPARGFPQRSLDQPLRLPASANSGPQDHRKCETRIPSTPASPLDIRDRLPRASARRD